MGGLWGFLGFFFFFFLGGGFSTTPKRNVGDLCMLRVRLKQRHEFCISDYSQPIHIK